MIPEELLCSGKLHGVATEVKIVFVHGGLLTWPEPKHSRNGVILIRNWT